MPLVFSLLLAFVLSISSAPSSPVTAAYDPDTLLAIQPEFRDDVAAAMPAGMTHYAVSVTIPAASSTVSLVVTGAQRVTYTNTTGEPLRRLPFRLYANSLAAQDPPLTITSTRIGDKEAPITLSQHDSVADVDLGTDLATGDTVVVDMTFELTVAINDPTHYGILNYDSASRTTMLAHWYPVVAGRDPEIGWMLDPVSVNGDPIFTDAGLYEVTITTPVGQALITSGVETDRTEANGEQTVTFAASPSRDFTIVASTLLVPTTAEVDGTAITSWALPAAAEASEHVAAWTANTLTAFNPLLGEYPYQQLQVAQVPVYSAAAVEFPQMLVLGTSFYSQATDAYSYFEFTTAHEAIHMWFYSMVGNNQYQHAFLDEGITNYLSADVYFREVYGDEAGDTTRERYLTRSFRQMVESNNDVIVDFPTDSFPTAGAYVSAVYTKAPLGFAAMHEAMGDDAFYAALRQYVAEFRFRVATPPDLEAILQSHTDVDIRELWSHWFERREGGLDIREL